MVPVKHVQRAARARGLALQPLQEKQDLQLVVPPVQLVPHLHAVAHALASSADRPPHEQPLIKQDIPPA